MRIAGNEGWPVSQQLSSCRMGPGVTVFSDGAGESAPSAPSEPVTVTLPLAAVAPGRKVVSYEGRSAPRPFVFWSGTKFGSRDRFRPVGQAWGLHKAGRGRVNENTAPPSFRFAAQMRPPCSWMIRWQIERPSPVPLVLP